MPSETVKLGSMEIEIITNAQKAEKEIQGLSSVGALGLGALGGVIGAVSTSMLGFANNIIQAAPNVQSGLAKIGTGIQLIGVNSNETFGFFDELSDKFLEFSKDANIKDVGIKIAEAFFGKRTKEQLDKNADSFIDDLTSKINSAKNLITGLFDDGDTTTPIQAQTGFEAGNTLIQAGARPEQIYGAYAQSINGQSSAFNDNSKPVVNVYIDGKQAYGTSSYLNE